MSSTGGNLDNALELIQKTYNSQTTPTNNNHENLSQTRPSIAKVSIHQPSRKNSVHDIHEVTKDDLNKLLIDIQENLSRLKVLLETMNSVSTIREEFFKLKDHLFKKIAEVIPKLANESRKRASITSKRHSIVSTSYHPQYLVYSIEYFLRELLKAQYLFNSLKSSSSIGSATLNSITIKPICNFDIDEIPSNEEDLKDFEDINQIKKDISNLEEQIYFLNQRYYSQIPDFHSLGRRNTDGFTIHRLIFHPKLSTTSSIGSNDNSHFCARLYQKCQIICCICTPNYI